MGFLKGECDVFGLNFVFYCFIPDHIDDKVCCGAWNVRTGSVFDDKIIPSLPNEASTV